MSNTGLGTPPARRPSTPRPHGQPPVSAPPGSGAGLATSCARAAQRSRFSRRAIFPEGLFTSHPVGTTCTSKLAIWSAASTRWRMAITKSRHSPGRAAGKGDPRCQGQGPGHDRGRGRLQVRPHGRRHRAQVFHAPEPDDVVDAGGEPGEMEEPRPAGGRDGGELEVAQRKEPHRKEQDRTHLRWKQRARGPRNGRGPAPQSRGAGPERPARSTRWRGGSLQPTGPRLRPTSTGPATAPCLSCRGLATSTSTHRNVRTNARRGRRKRASRDSREDDRAAAAPGATASTARDCPRRSGWRQRMDALGAARPAFRPAVTARHTASPACTGRGPEETRAVRPRNPLLTPCTPVH